ncbi:sugar kinase [Arthrobacter gandavensis]|uniref:sugar kinase n=1 Tax=Arthrobacter gandavensis TaxID=169960 RepID=UPI0018905985|nr:sugar kinase [Arthrobacter gandavensis]MBF4992738.1 sugar kinase [Arthrobacter gandavensis]
MSVVTIGESLGLLVASRLGRLELVPSMELGFGGAESNVAIGLARLGVPVTWMGRLGDDALGRLIQRQLRAEGVQVSAACDSSAPTALMLKARPTAGASAITYYRAGSAGSRLERGDLDLSLIRSSKVLHLTGITAALSQSARGSLDAAIDAAREAGATISFDVNHRSRLWSNDQAGPAYRALAARVDVVFAGEDEAELLTGEHDPQAQADAIAAMGPTQTVVKRGERGAIGFAGSERLEVPAFNVQAIDTVGAGDAFVAGYLAELIAGAPLRQRLLTAAACGAIACTAPGDWEAAPDRGAIARFLGAEDPVQR